MKKLIIVLAIQVVLVAAATGWMLPRLDAWTPNWGNLLWCVAVDDHPENCGDIAYRIDQGY